MTKNGKEKLKMMLTGGHSNPQNYNMFVLAERFIQDDKFFKNTILEIFQVVIPCYIEPIIYEGMKDGSILTNYPTEISEVVIIMTNIFLNPFIRPIDTKGMINKLNVFDLILKNLGLDLVDDNMIQNYVQLIETYNQFKSNRFC